MSEPARPDGYWTAARIVGIVYLTFCAGAGGGVFLFWHPQSVFVQCGLAAAVAAGFIASLIAGIPDPAARPIRWGLLWVAGGFVIGTSVMFGLGYLFCLATGF